MEGSLEAPTRHTIPWRDEAWYDEAALETELRRVFDVCHGCRRCFNLCDSFPILFDAVDERWGRLDSLVNVVGGTFRAPFADTSPKGWDAIIRVNLVHVLTACSLAMSSAADASEIWLATAAVMRPRVLSSQRRAR